MLPVSYLLLGLNNITIYYFIRQIKSGIQQRTKYLFCGNTTGLFHQIVFEQKSPSSFLTRKRPSNLYYNVRVASVRRLRGVIRALIQSRGRPTTDGLDDQLPDITLFRPAPKWSIMPSVIMTPVDLYRD